MMATALPTIVLSTLHDYLLTNAFLASREVSATTAINQTPLNSECWRSMQEGA